MLLALVVLAGTQLANAATYYVRSDGSDTNSGTAPDAANAWATINYASRAGLSPGDIVYVKAGNYTEQISPTVDGTVGVPIQFIADRQGAVPGWDAGKVIVNAPDRARALYVRTDDYLEFYGFHFVGSTSQAVLVYLCSGTRIENCDITSPRSSGLYCYSDGSARFVNLAIHDCGSLGLLAYGSTNAEVWHCTLTGNTGGGLRVNSGSTITLTNSIIASNGGHGIRENGGTLNHSYNLLHDNTSGNYAGTTQGTGEILAEPYFITASDTRLQPISPAIDAGTSAAGAADSDINGLSRPVNGDWDMGCHEYHNSNTYYVRADGNNSNDGQSSDTSGAWASIHHAATQSLQPGDIVYVQAGTYSETISPSVSGSTTDPIVFMGDSRGAVPGWRPGNVTVEAAPGSRCLNLSGDSDLTFSHFHFKGSDTRVVHIQNQTGAVLRSCEISGGDRGVAVNNGDATLVSCLVRGSSGVGVYAVRGATTLWNCTVVDNAAHGVVQNDDTCSVTSCIVAGNGGNGIRRDGGTLTHSYNLVYANAAGDFQGTSPTTGEISVDPLFDGSSGYRLGYGSPAIDAGTAAPGFVDEDLSGKPRPVNGLYDLGCYEASNFYFVRTDGSNTNSGTGPAASEAWATIQHAATRSLSEGDTVYVKPGDYNEFVSPNVDGISGAPIRFVADRHGSIDGWEAGDVVVNAPNRRRALTVNGDDYLEFVGFHFVGSNSQAVLLYPSKSVRLEDCDITAPNQSGLYCYRCDATLVNLFIHDCRSIGLYCYSNAVVNAWHCTVVNNLREGVRTASGGKLTLRNSVVAKNGTYGIRHGSAEPITHQYNLVFGNTPRDYHGTSTGVGEINSDPRLIGDGTFRLDLDSPAVNAGIDPSEYTATDIQGRARPVGGGWDMGCYEVVGAHWKLNEAGGVTAVEATMGLDGLYSSGPGLNALGPYPGEGDAAVELDGQDDHIDLPDVDFDFSNGFSIALWAKPTTALGSGNYQAFFELSNGVGADQVWFGWVGIVGMQLYLTNTEDGSSLRTIEDNRDFEVDQWVHCVVTVDADGTARLYRNGKITKHDQYVSLPRSVLRTLTTIGTSAFNDNFSGSLHDVRLYDRAISQKEVAALHGLVGHWELEELSGTVAQDSSGTGNHGSYANGVAQGVEGKSHLAAQFDGSDDHVVVPNDYHLTMLDDSMAVMAWVNPTASSNRQIILNKEGEYEVTIWPDGTLRWLLANSDPYWRTRNTGHVIPYGLWSHVALVYDAGTVLLYVNGEVIDNYYGAGPVGDAQRTRNTLRIGSQENSRAGRFFMGTIDDVRVYNRALRPEQISRIYLENGTGGLRIIRWVEVR